MRTQLVKGIKKFLSLFGVRLQRIDISKEMVIPQEANLDLLFDVGANAGQYVELIRSQGFLKQVVSFEPLLEEHENLLSVSSMDENWKIYERCAIGNANGYTVVNVSENSFSSSILTILDAHLEAAPKSKFIRTQTVPIYRLSDIWEKDYKSYERIGLKIDVQGFEMEVLLGAHDLLNKVYFIQLELSLIPVYENQKLYFEIDNYLRSTGFYLWKVIPGFTHPVNGQQFQFDGIYLRSKI